MYVIDENEDLIYEVEFDTRDVVFKTDKPKSSYILLKLNLVCGKDYVEVDDYGGRQGWIPSEYFTDDVQFNTVVCYFVEESVENALKENGFEIISKLPKIETPKE